MPRDRLAETTDTPFVQTGRYETGQRPRRGDQRGSGPSGRRSGRHRLGGHGAAAMETVGLIAAIAVLVAGLVAIGSCQPRRSAPVPAVKELRDLLDRPERVRRPPRTRPSRPRAPRPRPPRERPPGIGIPEWFA